MLPLPKGRGEGGSSARNTNDLVAPGAFSREARVEQLIAFDAVHEHRQFDPLLNGGGDILIEFRFEPGAAKRVDSRFFESEFPGLFENVSQAVLQALAVLAPKMPQLPPSRVSAGANVVEHSIATESRGDAGGAVNARRVAIGEQREHHLWAQLVSVRGGGRPVEGLDGIEGQLYQQLFIDPFAQIGRRIADPQRDLNVRLHVSFACGPRRVPVSSHLFLALLSFWSMTER